MKGSYSFFVLSSAFGAQKRSSLKIVSAVYVLLQFSAKMSILRDTMHPSGLEKIRSLEQPRAEAPPRPEPTITAPQFCKQLNSCNDLIEGQPAHFEATLQPVNDANLKLVQETFFILTKLSTMHKMYQSCLNTIDKSHNMGV